MIHRAALQSEKNELLQAGFHEETAAGTPNSTDTFSKTILFLHMQILQWSAQVLSNANALCIETFPSRVCVGSQSGSEGLTVVLPETSAKNDPRFCPHLDSYDEARN